MGLDLGADTRDLATKDLGQEMQDARLGAWVCDDGSEALGGFLQTKIFVKSESGRVTANFHLAACEAMDFDREAEKQRDTRIHLAIGFTRYVA